MHTPASSSNDIPRCLAATFRGTSAVLIGILLAGQAAACDFCLRLPRVPFEFDHPAAIEVALATQAAAARDELDLNPDVKLLDGPGGDRTAGLSEISPRQLIVQWARTRPAANSRSLRCTMELIFVDVDYAGSIDIRCGEILPGQRNAGPADVRLMTTKAGFCRLLEEGLEACEQKQLVAVESVQPVDLEELRQLFAAKGESSQADEATLARDSR